MRAVGLSSLEFDETIFAYDSFDSKLSLSHTKIIRTYVLENRSLFDAMECT